LFCYNSVKRNFILLLLFVAVLVVAIVAAPVFSFTPLVHSSFELSINNE